MMDFGNDNDGMEPYFADYPLRLYCVSEAEGFDMFHTELRELFYALKYRRNKERLQELFTHDAHYSRLSPDTVRALSVLLNIPDLWQKREQFRNRIHESEEYNMCQAWEEIKEECYTKGVTQGIEKGSFEKTRMIVQNMLKRGFSDKDICELTGCTAEFISKLQ